MERGLANAFSLQKQGYSSQRSAFVKVMSSLAYGEVEIIYQHSLVSNLFLACQSFVSRALLASKTSRELCTPSGALLSYGM